MDRGATERPAGPVAALLGLRFLAELGLLAMLGWGGWHLAADVALSAVLAVGLPSLAALVWGRWVAPRATRRLADPARLAVEVALFAAGFYAVAGAGPDPENVIFGLVVLAAFLLSLPARRVEL
jgi:hypothetical protein